MSKLDSILTKGPLISETLRIHLKQQIKDLMLEMIEDCYPWISTDEDGEVHTFLNADTLRQKVADL